MYKFFKKGKTGYLSKLNLKDVSDSRNSGLLSKKYFFWHKVSFYLIMASVMKGFKRKPKIKASIF